MIISRDKGLAANDIKVLSEPGVDLPDTVFKGVWACQRRALKRQTSRSLRGSVEFRGLKDVVAEVPDDGLKGEGQLTDRDFLVGADFDLMVVGAVDEGGLDRPVVVKEFGAVGAVGLNAAHFGGGQEDVAGLLLGEEEVVGCLVA